MSRIRVGKLLVWPTRKQGGFVDAGLSVHWDGRLLIWVRFGKSGFRTFTERYQGTRGMPVEWRYFLNGWVGVKVGDR